MVESRFQREVIERLEHILPGCVILKNDPGYRQGIPDLLVLFENYWAMLEVKDSARAPYRPNQEYYLELLNRMSFASVVHPENVEDVLHEIQQAFRPRRKPRVPRTQ